MKLKYVSLFLILCWASIPNLKAQMGNNWCFGKYAGINFSSTPPSIFHSEIKDTFVGLNSADASINPVTVSDCEGKLWFYGAGICIWNRNHQIMKNGLLNINRNPNPLSLSIPKPLTDSVFYHIIVNDYYQFFYTNIDMSKDNGLGEVDTSTIQLGTDSFLGSPYGVFVKHANDTDYWLILRTSEFTCTSFLVTKDSISRKGIASYVPCEWNAYTSMRTTRDGNQLINQYIHNSSGSNIIINLYDIDRSTGKLKKQKELFNRLIGVNNKSSVGLPEISANDSLIYLAIMDVPNSKPYQYSQRQILCQLERFNSKPMNTIKYIDTFYTQWHTFDEYDGISSMKLAPNNKIYFYYYLPNKTNDSITHIHSIAFPDKKGQSCKIEKDVLSFKIPTFVGRFLPCMDFPIKKMNFFIGMPSNTCGRDSVYFSINTDSTVKNVTWYFGDGDSSSTLNPVHVYNKDGKYHIQLKAETGANGCGYYQWFSDSLYLKIKPYLGLTKDTSYYTCGSHHIQVKLRYNHSDTVRFHWGDNTDSIIYSNNKSVLDSIMLYHNYSSGNYIVSAHVWNSNCEDSLSFMHQVNIDPHITAYFNTDYTKSCGNSTITLTDSSGGMDSIIQQRKWTIEHPNNITKQYDTVTTNKLKLIVQDTGYYNAKLIYITKQGCIDSLYKTNVFRILPQPVVYIDSPSHSPLCFKDSFILTAKQKDTAYPPLVKYQWNTGLVNTQSIKVDTANSYYVAASNAYGCGAQSNTVKISFLPQLFANIKTAKDSLYIIATRPIVSYTWYKDTVFYSNTSSLYHPATGRYYVHVVDGNGCVATSGSLLHTGLNHIEHIDNLIRVWPNPTNDVLYIEGLPNNKTNISLYDLLGKQVYNTSTNGEVLYNISIGHLAKGLYILSVGEEKVKLAVE